MQADQVITGDCRDVLPRLIAAGVRVQTCITSPPYYGLRDYGLPGQIGLEQTMQDYLAALLQVFRLVRELLTDNGTLWLNLGDSYATSRTSGSNLPPKNLMGIPWRLALALQDDGWFLRQDIIWHKRNPLPESVTDRCVRAHEYLFLLSKRERYYFNHEAIREPSRIYGEADADSRASFTRTRGKNTTLRVPGHHDSQHRRDRPPIQATALRNRRSVWSVASVPTRHGHIAPFPPQLVTPCILAGSRPGDCVLDPFSGSGTVAAEANRLGRHWLSIELDGHYAGLHAARTVQPGLAV